MALRMEQTIISNRGLLWMMTRRELKARYTGSVLGLFWTVIHPLIMLAIYVTVIGFFLGGGRYGQDEGLGGREWFAIFLCCGLLPWNWISESLQSSSTAITGNAPLIQRAVFPTMILPLLSMTVATIGFLISFGIFLLILGGFALAGAENYLGPQALALPLVFVAQLGFLAGWCYLIASLNVFFRDVAQILNAGLAIGFWATPIVYPARVVLEKVDLPEWLRSGFAVFDTLNPASHLVGLYHSCVAFGEWPNLWSFAYLGLWGAVGYVAGKYIFTRSQHHFADVV